MWLDFVLASLCGKSDISELAKYVEKIMYEYCPVKVEINVPNFATDRNKSFVSWRWRFSSWGKYRILYTIFSNDEYTIHSSMYEWNHIILILFIQASQTIDANNEIIRLGLNLI